MEISKFEALILKLVLRGMTDNKIVEYFEVELNEIIERGTVNSVKGRIIQRLDKVIEE